MSNIVLLTAYIVATIPLFAQTIDYSIDPSSVQCAGSFEASPGQGGASGCDAWSNGELLNDGTWYGSIGMTVYGTCNTSHQQVSVSGNIAWIHCAHAMGGNNNGRTGYTTTLQDGYLVYTGYVTADGMIWDGLDGHQVYESHRRKYCDAAEPVLIHSGSETC